MPGPVILLYHRVAEVRPDPQLLAVSPEHFREHLQVLREVTRPTGLGHVVDCLRQCRVVPHAAAISFDDGYRDNLEAAKPLLEEAGIPATVFVATGYTGAPREFWWDEVERIFLEPGELPVRMAFQAGDQRVELDLGSDCAYTARDQERDRGWNVTLPSDPTRRHAAYRRVCQLLSGQPIALRERALAGLRVAAGQPALKPRASHRAMDRDDVVRLARGGLVEVGAHTVNHPRLSALPPEAQEAEIGGAKRALEEIIGAPVAGIAYPFGDRHDYDRNSVAAAERCGFGWGCANVAGTVGSRCHPFELPRILVRDWNGATFRRFLEEWI